MCFSTQKSIAQATIKDSTVELKTNKFLDQQIDYDAEDSIRFDIVTQKVFLYGKAFVKYGEIELKAGYIEFDFATKTVKARGIKDSLGKETNLPQFIDGGQSFSAQSMDYNFETKKGLVVGSKTKQDDGYLHGDTVKSHLNNEYHVKHGKYTTCDLDHPHYYFNISKAIVKPNDKIVAGPLMLYVDDLPTPLAVPFGFFPNNQSKGAGIIIPTYDNSIRYGIGFLRGGYYIPFKDKADLQLTGSVYTRGNWGINAISRYKSIYKYAGNLDFSYQVIKNGHPDLNNFTRSNIFAIKWNHQQDVKAHPTSSFSANVNISSLNNYQMSFNPTGEQFLSNTFASSVQYRKSFANTPFSLNINAAHSQNTQTKQVSITLPDISLVMNRISPFGFLENDKNRNNKFIKELGKIWLAGNSQFKNTITVADSTLALNNIPYLNGQMRNGFQHNLNTGTSFKILNQKVSFNPSFRYTERWYLQTLTKNFDNTLNDVVTDTLRGFNNWQRAHNYSASASLTTKLYGMYGFSGFLKGYRNTKIRHVLTPSLSLSYNPNFDSRQFGYYGTGGTVSSYSPYDLGVFGIPPTGQSGSINMSLVNSLEMKMNAKSDTGLTVKKYSILDNFTVNGSYDIFKDSLKFSNVSMNARTTLFKMFSINGRAVLNPYYFDSVNGSMVQLNKSLFSQTGKIGRITSASTALNFNLKGDKFKKKVTDLQKNKEESSPEIDAIKNNPDAYVDFEIPWNVSFAYNINYSRRYYLINDLASDITRIKDSATIKQTIDISGDINLTENWKIGVWMNYDITGKQLSYTSINIYRNLHCWEMSFNWIPFGPQQSYNFQINVKSSVLNDLKLNRKRAWFDNQIQ